MHPQSQKLEEQIRGAIASHRRGMLLRGISLFMLSLLGGVGLLLLLARFDGSFSFLRWLALGATLCLAVFVFFKYILLPWRHTPTPQQVARRIEERHPGLEDRLATAVEVSEYAVSPGIEEMVRRLLNEVTMQTANVDFARQVATPFTGAWKILSTAVVAVLLIMAIVFLQPMREDLRSLFASRAGIVTGALTVSPGDTSVRRGSTVMVEAHTPESMLDKVTFYFSNEDTSWSSQSMTLAEPGRFTYELFEVQDTLRYYVRAGGELSSIFRITPLDAPQLRSMRLTYRYPASLGLPSRSTTDGGDIYGPLGTKVEMTATFSEALSSASLQIGDGVAEPVRAVRDSVLSANLEVKKDGFYRLLVSGVHGIQSEPLEYLIRLQVDAPPEITLRRPGRDARVTMLEEIAIEAEVVEDFELKKFDLVYAINDGAPQRMSMLPHARRQKSVDDDARQRNEYAGTNLLYVENFKVAPGDFVSYYIEAADRSQSHSSDIYFLEVRPFEEEFYMAISQGGNSGSMPNSLSISQKEIIVATWKLERERASFGADEVMNKSRAIAEAQRGVRDTIEQLRMMLGAQGNAERMGEYFERAIDAMNRAESQLEGALLVEALPPEREAYNYLLKADAEIRRRDLQRGRANAGAQVQSQEELQRLFADELDKMQSKYETLQNNQRSADDRQVSEALEKVRQLAQRQQQLNDMSRDLARKQVAEEERRRHIARLRREQEALTREAQEMERRLQNLSRQTEQSESSRSSLTENLKQATNEMSRATNSLNRDNPENASADGRRAVERLERLEEQLRRSVSQSMQERLSHLQRDFRNLAEGQRQLADSVAKRGPGVDEAQRRQWQQSQQRLRARAGELAQRLRQAERTAAKDQSAADRGLRSVHDALQKSDVQNRMQQSEAAIESNRLDESERQQGQALRGIRSVEDELERLQSRLAQSNEEKLEVALQQAQNLRRDLERQMQEQRNNSAAGSTREGGRPSPATNDASSPQSDDGRSQSGSQQRLKPEEIDWWRERMWQVMDHVERMRPMVGGDSTGADSYSALNRELNSFVRTFSGGDAQRLTDIESRLLDPLRRFEAELATRLTLAQQRRRLATAQDEQVPPGYRDMVDRYYEALARSKTKVKNEK